MKKATYVFVLLFALVAYAQEMDTTFVVNQKGQTVGIVHEHGTAPVIDESVLGGADSTAEADSEAPVQPAYSVEPSADSIAYYQGLIDMYTASGNKFRNIGGGMMIGGGIGTGLGVALMIAGVVAAADEVSDDTYCSGYYCDSDDDDDDEISGGALVMYLIGYGLVLTCPEVFIGGVVLKIVGGSKLKKAVRYQGKLENYRMRQSFSVHFLPTLNVKNGAVGGKLAFGF